MSTKLSKPVRRETARICQKRPIIVTLAPAGDANDALIGLHLKGQRTQYIIRLSEVYTMAALRHGLREKSAKKEARKAGIPWRVAKKTFKRLNSI